MFSQRAAYDALAARLAEVGLTLLIGLPRALQALPAAFLVSTTIAMGPGATFKQAQLLNRLRPTVTLAVNWQDQTAAEWEIVDLVDLVAPALILTPLSDVCRCTLESVGYDWREYGGITYRVADLVLILSQH